MRALIRLMRSLLLSSLLALLPITTSWAVPVFSLSASPTAPGGTMTLSVLASQLSDLYAYQFSLNFDPTLFSATSVSEGPFLASAGATFFDGGTIDNTVGLISFVFDTLIGPGPGASGSGILNTFAFTVLGVGTGIFSFSDVIALDSNLNVLTVQTPATSVTVPEPGTAVLVLIALLVIAARSLPRRPLQAQAG